MVSADIPGIPAPTKGASRFWATGIRSAHERAPGGRKPLACLAALEPGLTTYLPWVLCRFALILFVVKILIRKLGAGYFLLGCLRSSSIDLTMDRVADAHRRRGVVHPGCCSIFVSSWRRGFRGRDTDQPERRLKGLNPAPKWADVHPIDVSALRPKPTDQPRAGRRITLTVPAPSPPPCRIRPRGNPPCLSCRSRPTRRER